MKFVYIIKSTAFSDKVYVGITADLKQRLKDHNEGKSLHTAKYRPWMLETYVAFSNHDMAQDFEKYLKSGSGRAFAKKRLRG